MLNTRLKHLETHDAVREALDMHENLMICCGRMGPMCLPVCAIMEDLRGKYPHVAFYDQDFDDEAAGYIRALPECRRFMGLPFTVYFKNGKVAAATASIQTAAQVREHLDRAFGSAT